MLRSLGVFLLLASASLAEIFEDGKEDKQNFHVLYTPHNCGEWADTKIRIQIHETITKVAGRDFHESVQRRQNEVRRQLQTNVDCSAPCGCLIRRACRLTQPWNCVDTCGISCVCFRRLEDDKPRLLKQSDETVNAVGAGTVECDSWNQNLTLNEMDSILSCEATKSLKEEMAETFGEENSCLGDIGEFEAQVKLHGF